MSRHGLPWRTFLILMCLGALVGVGTGRTFAAFSSSTGTQGNTFSAAQIFPGQRSTSGWDVIDSVGGSAIDQSEIRSFTDGNFTRTKSFASAYSTDRYLEFDLNSPFPAGLSVSNVAFELTFADDHMAPVNEFCYYLEIRRASTSAVVGTYGSPAAPISCAANQTMQTVSTPTPAVSNTDIANDLTVRVFGMHSGDRAARIDKANITGSYHSRPFTLYPRRFDDRADGASDITRWGPSLSGDGAVYQTIGNWSNNFMANRYIALSFPAYVPPGSAVSSASIDHAYMSATNGDTTCWYLEVYDGTSLIGTHGSPAAPVSCNGTAAFVTDSVPIPEVDTVAEANNVVIRIYGRVSGSRRSVHDQVRLILDYSL